MPHHANTKIITASVQNTRSLLVMLSARIATTFGTPMTGTPATATS
jgi:hypothetical protein